MSEKQTKIETEPKKVSYEVVAETHFGRGMIDGDMKAAELKAELLKKHPAPARVRMRRHRDGSYRVWVRVPKKEAS